MSKLASNTLRFKVDGNKVTIQITEIAFGEPERILAEFEQSVESARVTLMTWQKELLDIPLMEKIESMRDEIHTAACDLTGMIEELGILMEVNS